MITGPYATGGVACFTCMGDRVHVWLHENDEGFVTGRFYECLRCGDSWAEGTRNPITQMRDY